MTHLSAVNQVAGGASLPAAFGSLSMELALSPGEYRQAFVLPTLSAQSHFSLGYNATRLNDLGASIETFRDI